MRTISFIIAVITALLLLSTLICGLWIKSKNLATDQSALSFHMKIGVLSVAFGIITIILFIIQLLKK
ncbi:MAG: hypothetical protein Q8936_15420 [Bacillota bacterium]|nr:hypothetical protein [Bacillota bacterium]